MCGQGRCCRHVLGPHRQDWLIPSRPAGLGHGRPFLTLLSAPSTPLTGSLCSPSLTFGQNRLRLWSVWGRHQLTTTTDRAGSSVTSSKECGFSTLAFPSVCMGSPCPGQPARATAARHPTPGRFYNRDPSLTGLEAESP